MGQQRRMKQNVMLAGVFALIFGVFAPAGVAAQTPETAPVASPVVAQAEWRVSDTRRIDVDGTPRSMSPDGQWLVGTDPTHRSVCTWDVGTLSPTCAGDDLQVSPAALSNGFVWAPDSSAVAFFDGVVALGESSAVMLLDIASGELTTLVRIGDDPVHSSWYLGLAWTNDSRKLVVGRVGGSVLAPLVIDRDGGASYTIPLPDWNAAELVAPVGVTPDDALILNVGSFDKERQEPEGLWRIGLDGSGPVQVLEAGTSYPLSSLAPIALSANGGYVSMLSVHAIARMDIGHAFFLADLQTGEIMPVEIDGSRNVLGPPLFSPDGVHALLQGGVDPAVTLYVLDLDTGMMSPVAGSRDVPFVNSFRRPPTWAKNDTIFVPTDEGGMLLTLEHDS